MFMVQIHTEHAYTMQFQVLMCVCAFNCHTHIHTHTQTTHTILAWHIYKANTIFIPHSPTHAFFFAILYFLGDVGGGARLLTAYTYFLLPLKHRSYYTSLISLSLIVRD